MYDINNCITMTVLLKEMESFLIDINSYFGISGLLTIIGLLLGFLYWLDKRKDPQRKLSHDAFKSFEQTFSPALYLLDDPRQTSYVIIVDELPKHEAAMLAFKHILEGKRKDRFMAKWTEYIDKCEKIRKYGYNICLGEDAGPPTIGILEHIKDHQGNLTEIETDNANKQELKNIIKELIQIAKN
jgi:hypothetical protein